MVPAAASRRRRRERNRRGAQGGDRTSEAAEWGKTEARLHAILSAAIAAAGFDEKTRVRYEASATEQEILRGAMEVPDAARHVFGFFRALDTVPTDPAGRDFFDGAVSDGRFTVDAESHDRQTALKEKKLRPLLGTNVHDYRASWALTGSPRTTSARCPTSWTTASPSSTTDQPKGTLCLDVWRSLGTLIRAELEMAANIDQQKAEIWAHEDFGRDRCAHFVGRKEPLAAIAGYLDGGDARPLAIVGEPGSGKSALMAKAIEQAQEAHSDALVAYRFIGATPASSDGRALLDSLCRQITRAYDGDESTIPSEYNDLAVEFGKRLELADGRTPAHRRPRCARPAGRRGAQPVVAAGQPARPTSGSSFRPCRANARRPCWPSIRRPMS